MTGSSHWSCHLCVVEPQQRVCCTKTCNHSLFAQKTIEQMMGHMIGLHGMAKPAGWTSDTTKNKIKNRLKKKQKQKKKKRRGR